jgi:hypothetical protein
MLKNASRKLTLALTLAALMAPAGRAFAQSTTTPPPPPLPTTATPSSVTGTNPEPQDDTVHKVLVFLHLA